MLQSKLFFLIRAGRFLHPAISFIYTNSNLPDTWIHQSCVVRSFVCRSFISWSDSTKMRSADYRPLPVVTCRWPRICISYLLFIATISVSALLNSLCQFPFPWLSFFSYSGGHASLPTLQPQILNFFWSVLFYSPNCKSSSVDPITYSHSDSKYRVNRVILAWMFLTCIFPYSIASVDRGHFFFNKSVCVIR